MPPLSEFFGALERLLGALYPYRLVLTLAAALLAAGVAYTLRRRGIDRAALDWARAHRALAAALTTLVLALALPVGYYTLAPLWTRTALTEASPLDAVGAPSMVAPGSNTPASTAPSRVLRRGALTGADAFHFGRGEVLLIETADGQRTLRFEGLSVRNGPDLFVYVSSQAESVAGAANLGALKATDGSFNYELPAGIDPATLAHALIWCKQFGVLFASAALDPPA